MNVVATAPIPGSKMPSLPSAGFTPTPFFNAMPAVYHGSVPTKQGRHCLPLSSEHGLEGSGIVRDDAIGAEAEQPPCFGRVVDGPEVDSQAEAVALRDERRAIEAKRTLV